MRSSHRMQMVQPPMIEVVGEMIRNHPGTISLGQGVVHYPPPEQAIDQLNNFLCDPKNHLYQAFQGLPSLLDALKTKLRAENGIAIDERNQVIVTAGGNMAFMNALLAITDPGDEIILQLPYYFNHEMAITMADCKAVLVATDRNYQLQPAAIKAAITDRTRAVVTISPNNPTGAVYPEVVLREVNQICREHGIYHISDEAYEYFTWGVNHFSPASIAGSSEHTISLYSLSKAYGFASWRIGYMVVPAALVPQIKKIQDTILICPPVISQFAAVGALQAGSDYCRRRLPQFAAVREMVMNELDAIRDFCFTAPADGAFYFLLRLDTKLDPLELVKRLVREHSVAAIPGSTFGLNDGCYLRIAYGALQKETVAEGMGRLTRGLRTILKGQVTVPRPSGSGFTVPRPSGSGCDERKSMNIVCVQLDSVWENKKANHDKARALLDATAPPQGSLVILSEMFATGFSMNVAGIDDTTTRETQDFLARTAADYGVHVMGGVVTTQPDGKGRNECVVYAPGGNEIARYCKIHPFTLGEEAKHYVSGEGVKTFDLQGFKVAPFICYDLRFPEIFRAAVRRGATLYTVIASWPVARIHHWIALLKARAIENQAYVIGVNRTGRDPKLAHNGHSLIVDPGGEILADAGESEGVISAELSPQVVADYRKQLPFLSDIHDEYLGAGAEAAVISR